MLKTIILLMATTTACGFGTTVGWGNYPSAERREGDLRDGLRSRSVYISGGQENNMCVYRHDGDKHCHFYLKTSSEVIENQDLECQFTWQENDIGDLIQIDCMGCLENDVSSTLIAVQTEGFFFSDEVVFSDLTDPNKYLQVLEGDRTDSCKEYLEGL